MAEVALRAVEDADLDAWFDASHALALFLDIVTVRPLHARAASDNLGSLRVSC